MPSIPGLPKHLALPSTAAKWRAIFLGSLNFYRIHLIAFTIIPLIMSGIMFGANTEFHISYIDCLFNCMSAMTVTGLATINLSTLSAFQQFLLFFQMIIGSLSTVSIIMILVRQYFFRQSFKHVVEERRRRRLSGSFSLGKTLTKVGSIAPPISAIKKKFSFPHSGQGQDQENHGKMSTDGAPEGRTSTPSLEMKPVPPSPKRIDMQKPPLKKKHRKVRPDMIVRVSGGGVGLVNPMGWYDGERAELHTPAPTPQRATPQGTPAGNHLGLSIEDAAALDALAQTNGSQITNPPKVVTNSPLEMSPSGSPRAKVPYAGLQLTDDAFPRSKTIAFDDDLEAGDDPRNRGQTTQREGGFPRSATFRSAAGESRFPRTATMQSQSGNFPRTHSLRPSVSRVPDTRFSGYGGFPTPFEIARGAFRKAFPETSKSLQKSLTIGRTNTIGRTSTVGGRGSISAGSGLGDDVKEVPYISFSATVGRNSHFHDLTQEQKDELGGVEYRALRVLLVIVVGYVVFIQLAGFVIIAPYIAANGRYDSVFDAQPRHVSIPWFALYQSVSAFSNTGMSLVDLSLVPFQKAYLMTVVLIILILAGNTAYPIFLRLTVWVLYKIIPSTSRYHESLKFLLDHPRRCFVYLFPSTQTWVLAFVMLALTFLVLDLGTPAIASIPVGTRVLAGLIQSCAVRAAGFGIVSLSALAPAVKVLYVIMMYISVYPIAISVRATNVYEEKSLGLFDEDRDETPSELEAEGAQAVAKYIGWHARRQLAFDIWWLGFALWLVCIIERSHIDDYSYFSIFNVIFELVSAYGTVGLSLGIPYDNYSFSGGFRKLSKLVVVCVMLRGRHRGLPVAIDRAVMLPKDFTAAEEHAFDEERSRRASRRGSMFAEETLSRTHTRRGSSGQWSAFREANRGLGEDPSLLQQQQQQQMGHRRSNSFTNTNNNTGIMVPSSPNNGTNGLQFSLPPSNQRESLERERFKAANALRSGGGSLTPVRESTMSRNPTRVEGESGVVQQDFMMRPTHTSKPDLSLRRTRNIGESDEEEEEEEEDDSANF